MAREALKRFAVQRLYLVGLDARVRAADDFNAAATTSNALTSSHRLLAAPSEIPTAWGAASSTPNGSAVTMANFCR